MCGLNYNAHLAEAQTNVKATKFREYIPTRTLFRKFPGKN